MRRRPTEDEILTLWSDLDAALRCAECALPSQMTEAMARVVQERERFNDLLLGREALRKTS